MSAQRDMLEAHCRRQGWPEPLWYEDAGVSGMADDPDKRPAFRAMLADAEARRFAVVLCVDLDRLSRSTVAALTAASRLERAGCRLVSLNQPGDFTTPDGELMFTVHASLARYESKQKGRRVRVAFDRMRAEGKWLSTPPYGARIGAGGTLEPDPATAPILARILERAAVASFARVADDLTRDGIPPPGSRRSPGQWGGASGHWWPATVSSIVRRATWLATQPEPWPSLWVAAAGRTRAPRVRATHPAHMLTGLMRCRCGGILTYGARSPYGRYAQCSSRRVRPTGGGCPHPHSYVEGYEAQVTAQLLALPPSERWVATAAAPDAAAWAELARARARLRAASKAGLYDDAPAELAREVAALAAREAALPRGTGDAEELRGSFDAIRAAFVALPGATQNRFLRTVVARVEIDGRAARVVWVPAVARACGLAE